MEITKSQFDYPADFSPENYFNNSYGIIVDPDCGTEIVEVKVFGNQRKYFESLPLHHSQTLIAEDNDSATFQFFVQPTFDFIQELFSYGEDIEV